MIIKTMKNVVLTCTGLPLLFSVVVKNMIETRSEKGVVFVAIMMEPI